MHVALHNLWSRSHILTGLAVWLRSCPLTDCSRVVTPYFRRIDFLQDFDSATSQCSLLLPHSFVFMYIVEITTSSSSHNFFYQCDVIIVFS